MPAAAATAAAEEVTPVTRAASAYGIGDALIRLAWAMISLNTVFSCAMSLPS